MGPMRVVKETMTTTMMIIPSLNIMAALQARSLKMEMRPTVTLSKMSFPLSMTHSVLHLISRV